MRYIISHTILFFYIYAVPFVFLPVSTRVLFGLLGFVILVLEVFQHKIKLGLDKKLINFLILLFTIPFVSMITININQTSDIEFIKYPISVITILFASYFVAKVFSFLYKKLDFKLISIFLINVIFIQSIISFLMFLIPDIRDILIGIQRISPQDAEIISNTFEFRLIGFGTMFFGAGIINGFGLILMGLINELIENRAPYLHINNKFKIDFICEKYRRIYDK